MIENKNIYVGNRYVPKIMGEWNKQESYEGLSIVTFEGNSYTSKKGVPIGVNILNEEYWVVTGNYNAQIENYRQDLTDHKVEVSTQLEQIGYNVTSSNVKADGLDKTLELQTLIEKINVLNTPNLFFPQSVGTYKINGDITIPQHMKLISNGATIVFNGKVTLQGDNQITGFVFDGEWNSKGIEIIGDNCDVSHNFFKNYQIKELTQLYVINTDNVRNIVIKNNTFDGIKPQTDDSSFEYASVSRAIRIYQSSDVLVSDNIFKGMDGLSDSDYVHVQSDTINDSSFPFTNGYTNGYFDYSRGVIIENNIFYHHNSKSDIKIQSSGVIVRNNEIIVNDSLIGIPAQIIRMYSTKDCVIQNNRIMINNNLVYGAISVSTSTGFHVVDNIIECRIEGLSEYMLINIDDAVECNISNNKISVFAKGIIFRLSGTQNCFVKNNIVTIKESVLNEIDIILVKNSGGSQANINTLISGNIFNGISEKIHFSYSHVGKVIKTRLINNIIVGGLLSMNVPYADDFLIEKNTFDVSPQYFITSPSGNGFLNKINLKNNFFNIKNYVSGKYTLYRSYLNIKEITFTSNDLSIIPDAFGLIYNDAVDFKQSEIFYSKGNVISSDFDHGNIRPLIKKQIGKTFFDTTLGYGITWNGVSWVNGNGVTV